MHARCPSNRNGRRCAQSFGAARSHAATEPDRGHPNPRVAPGLARAVAAAKPQLSILHTSAW
eukprot:scaffold1961_cov119-Isochrysis_galbana.AAC.5